MMVKEENRRLKEDVMLKLEEVEKLKLNTNDTHDLQEEQEHLKIMNKTLEDDKHILTMEN